MANPRRTSVQSQPQSQNPPLLPLSTSSDETQFPSSSLFNSLSLFLKRPQAFPFLLSVFVLLTWLSLRFQRPNSPPHYSSNFQDPKPSRNLDADANLVRFSAVEVPSAIAKDKRGWLVDPVSLALENGIQGGAQFCASVHMGEIRPGGMRGNHRHHTCNETFIIWGAETKFRIENAKLEDKDYAEVTIGADEVAVAASISGTAHALINVDRDRTTFFLGCQDTMINNNSSDTDYKVWKDL